MAINSVTNTGFNPYARAVGATTPTARPLSTTPTETEARTNVVQPQQQKSVADAIKQAANARAAQVSSAQAPEGVDQDLWSVLSKEERGYFVKSGAMGPLTYGRSSTTPSAPAAPIVRGGRLDIKA